MADEMKRLSEERKEFAGMNTDALNARLLEEKKALWTARFSLGKRSLTDTASLAKSRKRIARINTYLRRLEIEANSNVK